jgi:hypothetical protein
MTTPNSSKEPEQPTLSGLTAAEIALSDPLKAETRQARLYLLGVSMVSITIVYTGLVPKEITTLGIKFGEADRQSLLGILALVTLYFLVTFATYGVSDFIYWQRAYRNAQWSEVRQIAIEAGERARQIVTQTAGDLEQLVQAEEVPEVRKQMMENMEKTAKKVEESTRAMFRGMSVVQANEATAAMLAAAKAVATKGNFQGTFSLTPDERAIMRYSALSPTVASVRAVIEFLLPLLVGLYAIYALLVGPSLVAIIVGVATVAAALLTITVQVVRRRAAIARPAQTATQADSRAATQTKPPEAATEAARQATNQENRPN